mmetsp:Transcript_18719/g.28898  ORF Transcript_18719/g.28898 Transcript_18719/m.28898 type:complete len:202 (+) Transcript_18719:196-801(+)
MIITLPTTRPCSSLRLHPQQHNKTNINRFFKQHQSIGSVFHGLRYCCRLALLRGCHITAALRLFQLALLGRCPLSRTTLAANVGSGGGATGPPTRLAARLLRRRPLSPSCAVTNARLLRPHELGRRVAGRGDAQVLNQQLGADRRRRRRRERRPAPARRAAGEWGLSRPGGRSCRCWGRAATTLADCTTVHFKIPSCHTHI